MANIRPTRNRSTPESREFWDSAEKAAAEVATWPDERRAGINEADGRPDPEKRDHWISRSDYDELERRCDGLERELAQARELVAVCNGDGGQYQDRHGFRRACRQAQYAVAGAWTELDQVKTELATLRAELNRRPRVGDRVRVTIGLEVVEGVVAGVDGDRFLVRQHHGFEVWAQVKLLEVML